jgi:hypothetical protein
MPPRSMTKVTRLSRRRKGEVALGLVIVDGDADDLGAERAEVRVSVAEAVGLAPAAGREGFREEVEDDELPAKRAQADDFAQRRTRGKVGRLVADRKHTVRITQTPASAPPLQG